MNGPPPGRATPRLRSRLGFFGSKPGDPLKTVLVLLLFVIAGLLQDRSHAGDDLAVSYLGCQLLATGHSAQLYSFDPTHFSEIAPGDTVWHALARQTHFLGYFHPYVQTPLWAWSLQPLCTRTFFPTFYILSTAITLICFATTIFLIARFWTPELLNPLAIALILLILWFTEAFRYAMFLGQTHILFLLLTIAALILAERRRPIAAGILLALAAAVKITPAFFLLYWLITRRWRAAASMALCSAVLLLLTFLITGPTLFASYLDSLSRASHILLVSQNNQSFASWVMGRFYPSDEIFDLQSYELPTALRLGSTVLLLACTITGGVIDRLQSPIANPSQSLRQTAPLGAMLALVGITLFTPIAWTHYFIILIGPIMLLLAQAHAEPDRRRSRILFILIVAILLLNVQPIATDIVNGDVGRLALVRSQFLSGILCLITLALAALFRRRRNPHFQKHFRPLSAPSVETSTL